MASDPSLIEISGEDDSLLQQIPTEDVAGNLFSCSPLQIHGSKPHLPAAGSVNKENVNLNKYEMLKLSLEPQQMKRKKKGGASNLRKSLAWDRAFFTEEGFLDPVELSMISGNIGSSTGEKLPVIHEEGGESLSEFPSSQSDSGDLLALKEIKELPAKTPNGSRTKQSSSPHQRDALTKRDRVLVSSTKRKVLSNYDAHGNRSKRSGISQTTDLPSLTRPANANSTKVASKEAKASKRPATKLDSSLHILTAKTASRVVQPKHSQLAQSGIADKKNAGLRVPSSNKIHSRPSTPAGPSSKPPIAKSIVPQAKRNLVKSSSRPTSLTRRNDSSKEIEGRKNPSARNNDAGPSKVEANYPEKAHLTEGSIQHVQLKAAKPSSLRMPSPSLGFFNQQPKASTKGLLNNFIQPSCDSQSAIGTLKSHTAVKTLSELKSPHVHEKVQKMTIDGTNLNMGLEVSANSLNLEHQKQNAGPESQTISKMEVKMQHDTLENHQKIHEFLKDGNEGLHRLMEQHRIEIIPQVYNVNMPVDNDTAFLHMGSCGKEKNKKNDIIGSQCVEGQSKALAGDPTDFAHSPSADSSVHRIQSCFGLPDYQLHCAEDVCEFSEKFRVVDSRIYDNHRTSVTNPESQATLRGVGSSEEFQQICEENMDCSNDQDDNPKEEERSRVLPLKLAKQADYGLRGLRDSSADSYIQDSEDLVFHGSLTATHGGTSLVSDHAAEQVTWEMRGANDNNELLVGAKCMTSITEQPEVHAVEQVAHEKEGAIENDELLQIHCRNSRGEHQDNAVMIECSPPICQRACEVLSNGSPALYPVTPLEDVHQSDKAKTVEVLYEEENQSAQQESEPMVENSASFSNRKSTNDTYLPGQVDAFNLGSSLMVNRDRKMVEATDDTSASFAGFESDHCSGIKEEDRYRYVSTPLASVVQDGDDNMHMELKECDDMEGKQIFQSMKNASVSLMTVRPHPDTSIGTELLSREADNSSHENCHSGSFGQHGKLKDCILPNVSVHVEDPFWQDDADQTNEECHSFGNATKNSSAVVGQMQLLDGSSFIDCSLKMNGLVGDDNFSMASHWNEQSGYQPEHHDPCFIAELDSQTHHGSSSNDKISTMDNCLKEPKRCSAFCDSLSQDHVTKSNCLKADTCSKVKPVLEDNFGNIGTIYEDPNVEDMLSVAVQKHQSNIYDAFPQDDDDAVDANREELPEAEGVNVLGSSCQLSEEVDLDVKNDEAELPVSNQCVEEACQLKSSILPEQTNIYNVSLEDDDIVKVNREEFPEAEGVNVRVSSCQSSEEVDVDVKNDEAKLPISNQCIEEACQLKSGILPEQAYSGVPRESFSYDVQSQHQLGSILNSSKDVTTSVQGEICKKDGKQESAIVKPPPDAAPFSEEWLAAFEAAGEEILTMKCGAVQNSPPDKTLPEPSPWSPVKRKNNQAIGPYDCTKFTNICNGIPEPTSE